MQINGGLLRKNTKGEYLQSTGNIALNNIIDGLRAAGRPSNYINTHKITPSSYIVKKQILKQ